jgi:hypothetical protein
MKKTSKHPSLAQEIGFGSAQLHNFAMAGKRYSDPLNFAEPKVKGTATLCKCRK